MSNWSKIGIWAGGVLFGTWGLNILKSKEAKKAYAHTTAAVLRAKDCILDDYTAIKEHCDDIYADALDINEKRKQQIEDAQAEEVVDDISETEV